MIYLDNSATTQIAPEVYEEMLPYLTEKYGNPSSKYYSLAVDAKNAIEKSKEQLAALINGKPEEIIFTCGSTESNNAIIKGIADYKKYYEKSGEHIVTSKVEHHAVLNTCRFLNGEIYSNKDATFSLDGTLSKVDRGYTVTYLDVNPYGQVEPDMFSSSLIDRTSIASIIWGNNEIASINNISKLSDIAHKKNVFFHSDATQVLGKVKIDVQKISVDALSFSAHKLFGPKGIGALWVRSDKYGLLPPFSSLMHGGEQESGTRGGTYNVPLIVGFGKAAELAKRNFEQNYQHQVQLDSEIIDLILSYPHLELTGDLQNRIPGIYGIVVNTESFNNELFIKSVSDKFAVSSGSACTAGEPSHVLQAIGRQDQTSKFIRISISYSVEIDLIKQFLDTI